MEIGRTKRTSRYMPRDQLGHVPGCEVMQAFIGVEKDFEFNTFVHRKPVERVENGSNVIVFRNKGDKTGCRVLDSLKWCDGRSR